MSWLVDACVLLDFKKSHSEVDAWAAQVRHARRKKGPQPIACVGMREWIFTENSGRWLSPLRALSRTPPGTLASSSLATMM